MNDDMLKALDELAAPPGPAPRAFVSAVRARARRRFAARAGATLAIMLALFAAVVMSLRQPPEAPSRAPVVDAAAPAPESPRDRPVPWSYARALAEPPPVDIEGDPATLGIAYRTRDLERWLRQ